MKFDVKSKLAGKGLGTENLMYGTDYGVEKKLRLERPFMFNYNLYEA